MKLISAIVIGVLIVLMGILHPTIAWATPMADIRYIEMDLGGGFWRYEYTVFNASDPINDAGFDLFFVSLGYRSEVSLQIISLPTNWDAFFDASGTDYVDLASISPGVPPDGADIAPGASLGGFIFQLDQQVGDLAFEVTFVNPEDLENPFIANGNTVPVPEPATILLLAVGISGLGFFKRGKTMIL